MEWPAATSRSCKNARARATGAESDEALWRKWSVRVAFDRWRRSQVAAKHTVLRGPQQHHLFQGQVRLDATGLRAVGRITRAHQTQFSKLMQVAKTRLSLLMSNRAEERNTLKARSRDALAQTHSAERLSHDSHA